MKHLLMYFEAFTEQQNDKMASIFTEISSLLQDTKFQTRNYISYKKTILY